MTAAQTANLRIAEAPIWRENYIELTFDRRLSSNH